MLEPSIGLADNWANSTGLGWSRSLLLYYATIIVSVFDECVHVYIYIYVHTSFHHSFICSKGFGDVGCYCECSTQIDCVLC